ncbi:MAG: integration host factor subunit alpha [Gammaproteobacteria bacterium]|nr:MAG: integration host factor subunit alpha [Gammaproteobacteria bacterium]
MTITKADISNMISNELGLSKKDTVKIVDLFFGEISTILQKGEDVKLSGFGNFVLTDKKPRPGRNPRTSELVMIDARRVVTFKASKKLKMRIKIYAGRKPQHIRNYNTK